MRYTACALMLTILMTAGSAEGFGGRGRAGSMAYSWPVAPVWVMPSYGSLPVVAAPCPPQPMLIPRLVAPVTPIAAPPIQFAPTKPAPPSTLEPPLGKTKEPPQAKTKEPPLEKPTLHTDLDGQRKAPAIIETRSPVAVPLQTGARCKVGFWNLTGRDVEINVSGKTHTLARDRAMTLELDRQFTWNVKGQSETKEQVSEEKAFHEIVLRK